MNKSSSPSWISQGATNSRPGIWSDIVAFIAIVSGFQFMSLTYRFNILEDAFEVSLRSRKDLATIFLVYVLIVGFFKAISWTTQFFCKNDRSQASQIIQHEIGRSLLTLHLIITLHLVIFAFGVKISFHLSGHILAWVIIAEINQILCRIFKRYEIILSIAFFGRTIEIIIIAGQVFHLFGINFCDFL